MNVLAIRILFVLFPIYPCHSADIFAEQNKPGIIIKTLRPLQVAGLQVYS